MKGEPWMFEGGVVSLDNAKAVLEEGKDAIQWIDRRGESRVGLVLRIDDRALPARGRLKILVDTRGELDLLTYEKGTARDGIFIVQAKGGKDMKKDLSEFIEALKVKRGDDALVPVREALAKAALEGRVRDVDPALDGTLGVRCLRIATRGHAPTMYLEKVEKVTIDFEKPGDFRSLASITGEDGVATPGIVVYGNHRFLVIKQ